ncbi:PAS domain S-box protein [Mucilaginibacter sp. Bleaf8]|uniref:PAS domain S-box protein n=1 Tax=Mucilaginibacter sp. Bleaf8 TaxID=2834430 RepID=UPI001BD07B61|nr:PAS domain S-box protein [Mucilaginibacter sp. Bleaf8]MBS7564945.1 PAS domain S-box protein [Mucilaginibacter sp. Bleaf8]
MRNLWAMYVRLIEDKTCSSPSDEQRDIDDWKDRLFINFIKYCLPASLIALIPAIIFTIKNRIWSLAIVDFLALFFITFTAFSGKLSGKVKKILILLVGYVLAIYLTASLGYGGTGEFYLFVIPILAALILPLSFAGWCIVVNVLIIFAFAGVIEFKAFSSPLIVHYTVLLWLTKCANLVFIDVLMVSLIGLIFNGLKSVIAKKEQHQQNYKNVFELSPLPMWLFDAETLQFLDVNKAAINHYGYNRNEFLTMNIRDIRPAEGIPLVESAVHSMLHNSTHFSGLMRHKKIEEEPIDVHVECNLIDYNGKRAGLTLAADVTAQIKSEQEILETNNRLQTAQRMGKIGYWKYDCITRALFWSDEIYSLFGLEKSDSIISLSGFYQYIHPDDWKVFFSVLSPDTTHTATSEIEYRVVCLDQAVHYIKQSTLYHYNAKGELVNIEGIIQDVTERKLSELKIRESALNLRAILESSVEGFVLVNTEGIIKAFNRQSIEFLKLDNDHLPCEVGRSIFNYVEAERYEVFSELLKLVKKGQVMEYDKDYTRSDGLTNWIHYTLSPVFEDGVVAGVSISGRDVTVLKNYIQTIEAQNKSLAEISWTQSHLVRAPLARIMSLSSILKCAKNDADREEILSYMEISCNDLDDIIKRITKLSSIYAQSLN